MIKAEALFKRHLQSFEELVFYREKQLYSANGIEKAIIYAACIQAEAIRNDMDEFEPTPRPDIKP